ncbi:TetR/AcrR family transcriptional regulator [Labrenzia sp. VG12]|uniref:TetR/AcrR family transcriptional regulator n=1 Tax=Labrenzia sp. VG12 TaxID=2021862 RepID=UPI000B8C0026|nr:hypothetical protein CHH27_22380 [Labrenzia sp. VG12]
MTQIKNLGRVGKQEWLETALELLKKGGIDAVRVERLAARLDVAKSGFYYHFRDLGDLRDSLLDHWIELDHEPQRALQEASGLGPAEQLALIADVVDQVDLALYDVAIRQWARIDPKVRRIWRAENKKRLKVVRHLFSQLGFSGHDLDMRTHLFVAYHLSEREVFPNLKKADRRELRSRRLKFLVQT